VIVEELTVDVATSDLDAFLEATSASGPRSSQPSRDSCARRCGCRATFPTTVVIVVWWESRELWKAITDSQVAAIDRQMGEWFREPRVREHRVVR
jgi:hypothetical protein